MTVTVDRVKCACSDCVCVVGVDQGVKRDGRSIAATNAQTTTPKATAAATPGANATADAIDAA